jgi:hypothetical protein
MQQLWDQSGGDLDVFEKNGGFRFLSPQVVAKLRADQEAARRQQGQFDATLAERRTGREETTAYRNEALQRQRGFDAAQEARWNADRVSRDVGDVRDALRYEEQRRETQRHNKAMEGAAMARASKSNTTDQRQLLNTAVTTTLKKYKGYTPPGFSELPVEQRLVYLMNDSGAMAGLQSAASGGDPQAIADLGYIENAVRQLQGLTGVPPGVAPPPRPEPVGPEMPRYIWNQETGELERQ